MRVLTALTALALTTGCNLLKPPPAPSFQAVIHVEGDPGQPLAGTQINFKTKPIGVTDTNGVLQFKLKGSDGQVFDLSVKCPDGYESPAKPISVTLRKLADPKAMPEYRVSCPPTLRTVVVAVRAENGPNLPVIYLGRERTRTDQSGAAHLVLQVPPNQPIQLKLDTTEFKTLKPESPSQTLQVKDQDDVFVLEQDFKIERKYVPRARAKASGPTPI
jgi:hypothetical protein